VANTIDPLAGSYFIEAQTRKMEEQAEDYFRRIDELGGVIPAIEEGFFHREIGRAAYEYQKAVERERKIVVGVNRYEQGNEEMDIAVLKIDASVERGQVDAIKKLKEERDNGAVKEKLEALKKAAAGADNTMPYLMDCARVYATEGEMTDVLKQVFGEYREPAYF
jgi:methylmalonyl-CoA mutase N-terminal domain/subunit